MMRLLLLALALAWLPGTAAAQSVPQSQALLQQIGVWGQQLVATQQPVTDAYQKCAPTFREVMAMVGSASPDHPHAGRLVGDMRSCLAEMKAAAVRSRDAMARMAPMPREIERMINIDSRDVLQRSAASIDGTVVYLELVEQGLAALVAGDGALAMRKLAESRVVAGSSMDGQILLIETMRPGMPMETHKAMLDIRLAIMRAVRAVAVHDPGAGTREVVVALHAQAVAARTAAAQMRASWAIDSRPMRNLVARLGDARRSALFKSLDDSFGAIADTGDAAAAALERLPAQGAGGADLMRVVDELALLEMRILDAVRTFSVAASQMS